MVPMAIVDSEEGDAPETTISLSRTVCTKAMEEKSAVLIEDALSMGDFNPSKSIVALNIRSAICSPLWHGEEITGLIYFDNRSFMLTGGFKRSQLDLLSAIGYQVALGIEKFKLVEKVRREEMLRANLQRYHSPDVIDTIISHLERNEELLVQETEVTIVFCDIVGFTKLAEKKEPIEVAKFLNEYLSIMTEIVFEHGGTLDKYIGDAIMAVFGAPVSKGEDARQAVLASLKMRDSIQRRMSFRHPVPFEVRVGINTGRVVAGNFGSLQRMEYTVIGDPVNVAARLESYSEPSRILIGEATHRQVAEYFNCDFAGEYKVRGRQEPVKCWWVNGVGATETMPLDSGMREAPSKG